MKFFQIKKAGLFFFLVVVIAVLSSCTGKRYGHLTMRVGSKSKKVERSHVVRNTILKPGETNSLQKDKRTPDRSQIRSKTLKPGVISLVSNQSRSLPIDLAKLEQIHSLPGLTHPIPKIKRKLDALTVARVDKPLSRKNSKKPTDDVLLTIFALLLLLLFLSGLFLLLNHLFFKMTFQQAMKSILAVLIGIFVVALIVVAIGGPDF